MFVKDITEGIADTGVKAAILKCATEDAGLTPGVERVLRAVAQAHRRTGVPITTHTHAHTHRGRDQQRVFKEEGVDLSARDHRPLRRHHRPRLPEGADRTTAPPSAWTASASMSLLSFEDRVNTVAELCKQGYAGKMVLSHDASCFIDWFDAEMKEAALPKWNYTHISDDVLPALRARGVTEAQINQMLVENPRRIFEHGGAY